MSKRKKNQKAKQKRRRLDAYKRSGKTLAPPLTTYLNVRSLDYHRQLLPQLLWLESVLDRYGEKKFPGLVHRFLDLVAALGTTGSDPVSGMVESFLFVPEVKRTAFVHDHRDAVQAMVVEPFGPALLLYGTCPMKWLMDLYGRANYQLDLDSALASLRTWTGSLLDREGDHANMTRTMVLARYINAGKVLLPNDPTLINELTTYPNCKDRRETECMLRAMSHGVFDDVVHEFTWGDAFWSANGRISMCTVDNDGLTQADRTEQDKALAKLTVRYGSAAEAFFNAIREDHQKCFPDPSAFEKTSVLSGLLARASALGLDMLTEQALWKAEVGGILLRCLCETLVLLAWLVRKDEASLYQRFVQHSLGQQDLYGLKLEGYEGYREAFQALRLGDEERADAMAEDSWDAQMRTINLGNWADTDTRKMAEEGGTKVYYDLVFSLCSADVHSQFISLAQWNMVPCKNPLHNYHLLPAFGRRIINPFLPLTACVLLKETCQRFFEHYKVEPSCTKVLEDALAEASAIVATSESGDAKSGDS
jgi:hypothetical protein